MYGSIILPQNDILENMEVTSEGLKDMSLEEF
jgi:hypothetical protein